MLNFILFYTNLILGIFVLGASDSSRSIYFKIIKQTFQQQAVS